MNGDVGLSGGYGLWGPAIGPTIYPDLHPTIDQFPRTIEPEVYGEPIYNESTIIETPMGEVPGGVPLMQNGAPSGTIQSAQPPTLQPKAAVGSGQSVSTPIGSTTPAGATAQPGRNVKPADFKFIDGDIAAELSGVSNK
jgi:general secretion pathway protein D